MGKFDLFDKNSYNDELNYLPVFDWKIYACQAHMSKSFLQETVKTRFKKQGMILEIQEPMRMVFEHPNLNSPIEISFEGSVTADGTRYALCFHSASFGRKIEDARNQEMLYDIVFSLIPAKWRKESYYTEDGKDILMYKPRRRLKQKNRKKGLF